MRPMKAFKSEDRRERIHFPCHFQPKLNGLRMMYREGVLQSGDEVQWRDEMLPQIRDALTNLSADWILDGELYKHGWSRQTINGAGGVNRLKPNPKTLQLQYHVFDGVYLPQRYMSFTDRHNLLFQQLYPLTLGTISLVLVETHQIFSHIEADIFYRQFKEQGYEGGMYRDSGKPYGFSWDCGNQENRWNYILKRKDWLDREFPIVDTELGSTGGKYENCVGALVCQTDDGMRFSVSGGLSDLQRLDFMDRPPLGRQAVIRFESWSDAGIPLQPQIEDIL